MVTAKEKEPVKNLDEQLTTVSEQHDEGYKGPTVRIMLPPPLNSDSNSRVDMYEHVTIANQEKEEITYVRRGEWVEVPVPVYLQLKIKYPNI